MYCYEMGMRVWCTVMRCVSGCGVYCYEMCRWVWCTVMRWVCVCGVLL